MGPVQSLLQDQVKEKVITDLAAASHGREGAQMAETALFVSSVARGGLGGVVSLFTTPMGNPREDAQFRASQEREAARQAERQNPHLKVERMLKQMSEHQRRQQLAKWH
jgi:hypothetical protein